MNNFSFKNFYNLTIGVLDIFRRPEIFRSTVF